MQGAGALDEGVHEGGDNVVEHGAERLFKHAAGKLVAQFKIDPTGVFAQRREAPAAFELAERAVDQGDVHAGGEGFAVAGGKMRLDAVIMYVDGGGGDGVGAFMHLRAAAPGQKLGIVFTLVDQREHLRGGKFDQDVFADFCHGFSKTRVRDARGARAVEGRFYCIALAGAFCGNKPL